MDTSVTPQGKRKGAIFRLKPKILIKRTTATTGAARIGIPNIETFPVQAVIKMNLAAIEILEAGLIDQEADAVAFKDLVALFLVIKRHAILKPGATTRFYKNTKELPFRSLFLLKLTNLRNCTVC